MSEKKSIPYICERCRFEGSYVGALMFPTDKEPPKCKEHGQMSPVKRSK